MISTLFYNEKDIPVFKEGTFQYSPIKPKTLTIPSIIRGVSTTLIHYWWVCEKRLAVSNKIKHILNI